MSNSSEKVLALFDFDGTITTKDSMLDFVAFHFGKAAMRKSLFRLAPRIAAMKTRLTPPQKVKERMLWHFFKEKSRDEMLALGKKYANERLHELIRPKALEKIQWHQSEGHDIYVVSASCEEWILAWAESQNIGVIASKMAYGANGFTGKLDGRNCNKEEKVRAVEARLNTKKFNEIYAYGDTSGDKALLAFATQPFYRAFE